jgi:hypothetical protein
VPATLQGVAPFPYQDRDVLSWIPDGIDGRSADWRTRQERVSVPSGGFAITAPALHPVDGQKAIYRCFSRADHAAIWTWLSAQLGRYAAFWCPSFQRDLDILDSSGLGTWIIRAVGFAARFALDPSQKYLYGFNQSGANGVAVLVLTAIDNGDGTETLTYSTDIRLIASNGSAPSVATSVQAASLLRFARLDSDSITETWVTPSIVDVAVSFASITAEQP